MFLFSSHGCRVRIVDIRYLILNEKTWQKAPLVEGVHVTHQVAVMGFGHEKHSSHQVSSGDALCAFTLAVTAFTLHQFIRVLTICCQGDVIWKTNNDISL